jgi:putative aminopeptidase FrvX
MNYEKKYLKYKAKYVTLKNQFGGIKGVRAEYEYEVYKYCNQKLKELGWEIKVDFLDGLIQLV